jgi:hypothetical protein
MQTAKRSTDKKGREASARFRRLQNRLSNRGASPGAALTASRRSGKAKASICSHFKELDFEEFQESGVNSFFLAI